MKQEIKRTVVPLVYPFSQPNTVNIHKADRNNRMAVAPTMLTAVSNYSKRKV